MANTPYSHTHSSSDSSDDSNAAADLIRQKLENIFAAEPDAKQELAEAEAAKLPRSKHQQFMEDLNNSGRSLAEIQTAWHTYYIGLPDNEKHAVWQEFYAANNNSTAYNKLVHAPAQAASAKLIQPHSDPSAYARDVPLNLSSAREQERPTTRVITADHTPPRAPRKRIRDTRSVDDVKHQIKDKITAGGKLKAKHHFQSLAFGLAVGFVIVFVTLFGFFNEVFIAPFIQPDSHASATPVILDPTAVTVGSTPEVIIPKINVEIPVDYSQTTTDENQIENALEKGIVHYPSTVQPGQQGNAAYFGHSSNNIFNPGKYKFAFVLLHELVLGDTFYLTNNGKAYVYKVISRDVVDPSDVGVLNAVPGQTATATLITCDPPGTSLKRLVIVGQQISPDPSGNATAATPTSTTVGTSTFNLPGNGPTLWSRFWGWLF
jgi:LPXTG-site transpeptidase (sortase) family protein